MNSPALGLTAASPATNHPISGQRKTIRYELTEPQKLLTSTGLLMEGNALIEIQNT
jgi:hypothetical protein